MDFNAEPYWDDFQATNGAKEQNYMRILFRPGYAVQARELTQIQSILQNQIKQFGDHVFADGSPVMGGHISLRTDISYIKLEKQYGGKDIDLDNFYGLVVYNQAYPQSRAKIIQTYSTDKDTTILVRYLRGPGFSAGDTIQAGTTYATVSATPYTGVGSLAEINDGVFYVDGYFVSVAGQSIVLDAYSDSPSYKVGLEIQDTIITESDDTALLDPAQESFNYQAPGAHRYQHTLVLAKRKLDSIDDSKFFELLRVENGVVTKQTSYPIYSELEKTLARRTYDESGDYAVKPFIADVSANTPAGLSENTSTFIVNVNPGKAYIKGMEFETIGTSKLSIDRARTTKTSNNFSLSTYYGNRLLLANVIASNTRSVLMSEGLIDIDIHCVSNNQVSLTGATDKYYATRIGTAKVRNFDRSGVDANSYYIYLTDVNFQPIVTTANTNSPNNRSVSLKPEFSATANAYQNAIITLVNTTNAVGNTGRVISYDTTTKIAVVDTPFNAIPAQNDIFTVTLGIADTESLMIANNATFTSANLMANISAVGKDATGNTIIEDSNWDLNLYPLPSFYIKQSSDTNVAFYRRYIATNQAFATNGAISISLPSNHTYDFGTNGGLVSAADIKENIIVVASDGSVVDLTVSPRSVYRTSATQIIIYTNSTPSASFIGDVYVTAKVTNASPSLRRTKTLYTANSGLTAYDKPSFATAVANYGSVLVNASNGITWFTNANSVVTNSTERMPLYVADVIAIKGVYDSANVNYAPNTANASTVDITNRYLLDSGQNDSYYDYASLRLKPGAPAPVGQVAVVYDYYSHSGTGYLSAASYPPAAYTNETIPIYRNAAGSIVYLRDAIDFRPVRTIGTAGDPYLRTPLNANVNVSSGGVTVSANISRLTGNTIVPPLSVGSIIKIGNDQRTVNSVINTTTVTVSTAFATTATNAIIYAVTQNTALTGTVVQRPTDPFVLDYEFYLPRIDKIVVTKDKAFKVLSGIASQHPVEPTLNSETEMAIYRLYIPAYTASLRNITLDYIENRRYTMKDIAGLDDRIKALEDYIRLKGSETQTLNNPPTSARNPAIVKPIYGTFVDEFTDISMADQTPDTFSASIENGLLSCYKVINSLGLQVSDSGGASVRSKFVTLPFTETSIVSQPLATLSGSETVVNNALIGNFDGYVTLTPETDYFYSTVHIPTFYDILSMMYGVAQTTQAAPASLSTSYVLAMGGSAYSSYTSNSSTSVLTGSGVDVSNQLTVTVAATNSNVAQTEPVTTNQININFAGAAPYAALSSIMTGLGAAGFNPNINDPAAMLAQGDLYAALAAYYGYV